MWVLWKVQKASVSCTQLLVKNTSIRSGSETTFTFLLGMHWYDTEDACHRILARTSSRIRTSSTNSRSRRHPLEDVKTYSFLLRSEGMHVTPWFSHGPLLGLLLEGWGASYNLQMGGQTIAATTKSYC